MRSALDALAGRPTHELGDPLLNEGLRILEEGVAIRASDIDVVWTAGYGFPRYRGGPMFHADVIGLPALLDRHPLPQTRGRQRHVSAIPTMRAGPMRTGGSF